MLSGSTRVSAQHYCLYAFTLYNIQDKCSHTYIIIYYIVSVWIASQIATTYIQSHRNSEQEKNSLILSNNVTTSKRVGTIVLTNLATKSAFLPFSGTPLQANHCFNSGIFKLLDSRPHKEAPGMSSCYSSILKTTLVSVSQ